MELDHVVLWVEDPKRALEFYVDVIGLEAVRAEDFEKGKAPFPSVRVNDTTIIDLMGNALLPLVRPRSRRRPWRSAPAGAEPCPSDR